MAECAQCPKCKAPRVNGCEYCVCGHKWAVKDVFEMLEEMTGIELGQFKAKAQP